MATPPAPDRQSIHQELDEQRSELLDQIEEWLEGPVIVLGFIWLVLLVIELIWGLSPFLAILSVAIYIIFIIDFSIRLFLAPHKAVFLKHNWLTALSLVFPALRVLRLSRLFSTLRIIEAAPSLRMVKTVSSINRGLRNLRRTMHKRGLGFVILLSLLITLVGSAALYSFESAASGGGLSKYSDALWYTAMLMTTMGSSYSPKTVEGRILTFLLALYAFAIFGYITAAIATYLIGQESKDPESNVASEESIRKLQNDIESLRSELIASRQETNNGRSDAD